MVTKELHTKRTFNGKMRLRTKTQRPARAEKGTKVAVPNPLANSVSNTDYAILKSVCEDMTFTKLYPMFATIFIAVMPSLIVGTPQ